MRTVGWALGVVLGAAGVAAAATWQCAVRSEGVTAAAYVAIGRCTGTGPYTTGGDPVADGSPEQTGKGLCGTAARTPTMVLAGAGFTQGGTGVVVYYDHDTRKFVAYTAAATPGPDVPLAQLAAGTSVNYAVSVLAVCR